jgi:inorganic pyrophosphatase
MKYEWDKDTDLLKLNRVLHSAVFHPQSYWFIPQMADGPLQPGAIVDVRPIVR